MIVNQCRKATMKTFLEEVLLNAVAVNEFPMEQSANDYTLDIDETCGWGNVDNPPALMPFCEESGLTVPVHDENKAVDYFYLLFNLEMWLIFAVEMNSGR